MVKFDIIFQVLKIEPKYYEQLNNWCNKTLTDSNLLPVNLKAFSQLNLLDKKVEFVDEIEDEMIFKFHIDANLNTNDTNKIKVLMQYESELINLLSDYINSKNFKTIKIYKLISELTINENLDMYIKSNFKLC